MVSVLSLKFFLAPLAIEFRIQTVTAKLLYILRMPTHTYNMIIPRTSDFLKLEDHR